MNCKITVTPDFLREMKRLAKRYKFSYVCQGKYVAVPPSDAA